MPENLARLICGELQLVYEEGVYRLPGMLSLMDLYSIPVLFPLAVLIRIHCRLSHTQEQCCLWHSSPPPPPPRCPLERRRGCAATGNDHRCMSVRPERPLLALHPRTNALQVDTSKMESSMLFSPAKVRPHPRLAPTLVQRIHRRQQGDWGGKRWKVRLLARSRPHAPPAPALLAALGSVPRHSSLAVTARLGSPDFGAAQGILVIAATARAPIAASSL